MAAKNDITGDSLVSRTSEAYRNNYDTIFGKKGKTNEQRTGCVDGKLVTGKETGVEADTENTMPAHDRVPTSSGH